MTTYLRMRRTRNEKRKLMILSRSACMAISFVLILFSTVSADVQTLTTAESPFNIGLWNQGWWSDSFEQPRGGEITDNYLTGLNSNNATYRGFFMFDLSNIHGEVDDARIRITLGTSMSPDPFERLGLFEVATSPIQLNSKPGVVDTSILEDLGTGVLLGETDVSIGSPVETIVDIQLNEMAITKINSRFGDFFSIGTSLLDIDPNDGTQFLFGNTGNRVSGTLGRIPNTVGTPAELILNVVPEPNTFALLISALFLIVLRRRADDAQQSRTARFQMPLVRWRSNCHY